MSNSRIYVVRASDSTCRLVRAANQAQAVRHAAKAEFTAAVATQGDLVELLPTHQVEEANRVSLDKLCRAFGLPTKGQEIDDEIDGSKVWDFVQAGRIEDVAIYCGGDVERVRELHRRMTFAYQAEAA